MAGSKPALRIGLIGTGFMGKTHAFGFATAPRVFDLPFELVLHTVADRTDELAAGAAARARLRQGHRRLADASSPTPRSTSSTSPRPTPCTRRWRSPPSPPASTSTARSRWRRCAADAREMAEAAEAAGVKTQVGFNYLCNPMLGLAREMIAAGELGEIRSYRGVHAEDYMADADRARSASATTPSGGGALADIGSHALATAEFLLGPIAAVLGDCVTVDPRAARTAAAARRAVETDDVGPRLPALRERRQRLGRGELDRHGPQDAARLRGLRLQGRARSSRQERFNELHFYSAGDAAGRRGFRRIEAGPDHPPYGRFCVAPGHQLGFNDLKAIEMARFLDAIAGNRAGALQLPRRAAHPELVETIHRSAREGGWQQIA